MINRERLTKLFTHLVSIDSPSLGEREMCDYIGERLKILGIPYQEDETGEKIGGSAGNLYAYIEGELDLPPLLFSESFFSAARRRLRYPVPSLCGR